MRRLAALVDRAQYVRISGVREERMIARCRRVLEPLQWTGSITNEKGVAEPLQAREGACRVAVDDAPAMVGGGVSNLEQKLVAPAGLLNVTPLGQTLVLPIV